jgi:hypothetical protein
MRTRMRVFGVVALLLGMFTTATARASDEGTKSQAYRDAYARGHREADADWKKGKATVYSFGLRSAAEELDRDTGLTYEAIAGCIVDDGILGRAAGHNARLKELIARHGPPANSRKPWDKELFGLKFYFEAQAREIAVAHLKPGGAAIASADGKFRVRLLKADPDALAEAKRYVRIEVKTGNDTKKATAWWLGPDAQEVEAIWGPAGSDTLIVRFPSIVKPSEGHTVAAVDLRTGNVLRAEY